MKELSDQEGKIIGKFPRVQYNLNFTKKEILLQDIKVK